MVMKEITGTDVLTFWFEECSPKQWWIKDPQFDDTIKKRFAGIHAKAHCAELYGWRESAAGRLAEIIVLDQFSRNMYRNTPQAFASDPLALILAQEAVAAKLDDELDDSQRGFLYLPYMHSESKAIHIVAEDLYKRKMGESNYRFETRHKAIIDQFGRYPHRNEILGRESTAEEKEFLTKPGSGF